MHSKHAQFVKSIAAAAIGMSGCATSPAIQQEPMQLYDTQITAYCNKSVNELKYVVRAEKSDGLNVLAYENIINARAGDTWYQLGLLYNGVRGDFRFMYQIVGNDYVYKPMPAGVEDYKAGIKNGDNVLLTIKIGAGRVYMAAEDLNNGIVFIPGPFYTKAGSFTPGMRGRFTGLMTETDSAYEVKNLPIAVYADTSYGSDGCMLKPAQHEFVIYGRKSASGYTYYGTEAVATHFKDSVLSGSLVTGGADHMNRDKINLKKTEFFGIYIKTARGPKEMQKP